MRERRFEVSATLWTACWVGATATGTAATVTWVNPSSGVWGDASNWSSSPSLPGPADDVVIDRGGVGLLVALHDLSATVNTLTSREIVAISGVGSLTIASSSWVDGAFQMFHTSSLLGAGHLSLRSTDVWDGGLMAGAGVTRVEQGATLSMGSAYLKTIARRVENAGAMTWSNGGLLLQGATLVNEATGRITANGPQISAANATPGRIENHGLFEKAGAAETWALGAVTLENHGEVVVRAGSLRFGFNSGDVTRFNNHGATRVEGGLLHLGGGGSHAGLFRVETTGVLLFEGGHTFGAGTAFEGPGAVRFGAGTQSVNHSIDFAAPVEFSDGQLRFVSGQSTLRDARAVIEGAPGGIRMAGGDLTISGEVRGVGVVSDSPEGSLTVAPGASLIARGLNAQCDFANYGSLTFTFDSQTSASIDASFGGTAINHAGGVITSLNTVTFHDYQASEDRLFINEGVMNVVAGMRFESTSGFDLEFENRGVVNVLSHSFQFGDLIDPVAGAAPIQAGRFVVSPLGALGAIRAVFGPSSSIETAGHVGGNRTRYEGSFVGAGTADLTACDLLGVTDFVGTMSFYGDSATRSIIGGVADVRGTMLLRDALVSGVLRSDGLLRIGSNVAVNGLMEAESIAGEQTHVFLRGAGTVRLTTSDEIPSLNCLESLTFEVAPGAALQLTRPPNAGLPQPTFDGTLRVLGAVTQETSMVVNGAVEIGAGALLQIASQPAAYESGTSISGAGHITNAGHVHKTSTMLSTVSASLTNTGLVQSSAGALRFTGAFDNHGTVRASGVSSVELTGSIAQRVGSALTGGVWQAFGNGLLRVGTTSIVSNAAEIDISGSSTLAFFDTLALNTGSIRFTGGALHWGAPAGGTLSNAGDIHLGVGSGMLLTGGFTQSASGDLTLELGGRGPLEFGGMSITGPASLHGSLTVALVNGFAPVWGDEFIMMHIGAGSSGEFDSFSGAPLSDPLLRWWRERRTGEFVVGVRHAGDVNRDLVVNFLDLNAVLGEYGVTGAGLLGDANEDGVVNFIDLNIVVGAYGVSAPAPVPAPGAVALLAGAAALRGRRRA